MRALTLNSVTGSYLLSGDAAPRLELFMPGWHVNVALANMWHRSLKRARGDLTPAVNTRYEEPSR